MPIEVIVCETCRQSYSDIPDAKITGFWSSQYETNTRRSIDPVVIRANSFLDYTDEGLLTLSATLNHYAL